MNTRFSILESLNAGDFQHLNGSLETHLKGTAALLKKWGASEVVQTAGLFHAAYGTAGFSQHMVSLEQRQSIAQTIGKDAEALVYLYCSCDRNFVFPQFGKAQNIVFRDRFTGTDFELSNDDALMFCELTVANELELVYASDAFKKQHGHGLYELFNRLEKYLSQCAKAEYKTALSDII